MSPETPKNEADCGEATEVAGRDFRLLSNTELHKLLCAINPEMSSYAVTDDTRETVIAMLEIARSNLK
jgi:hypothetical protein